MSGSSEDIDMSAGNNDLISLMDTSVHNCRTGTLIDLTDDTRPFPSALMTIAEVDDTFGLFSSKPRANSAPESSGQTSCSEFSIISADEAKNKSEFLPNENSVSKGTLSSISPGKNSPSRSIITMDSNASGINDAFVSSTVGDFQNDSERSDSYNQLPSGVDMASTPMIRKSNEVNEDVFASPQHCPSSTEDCNNDQFQELNANSSAESDLLDIENLSTFSISDSSDTSATELKKGKFDFLSPRKAKSPGSSLMYGKQCNLFHKNISIDRRILSESNSDEISSDRGSSSSMPLVMALRKKMSEKAAMQKKMDNRSETMAPIPSRRYFTFSQPNENSVGDGQSIKPLDVVPDSPFASPEPNKHEFVFPTPVKEYAEARKLTTPTPSKGRQERSVTTPTKKMSLNVSAIVTPSRQGFTKPSTPSSGLVKNLTTPTRSLYGSAQSLSNGTPISMRHSFSTSSSSGSEVSISRKILSTEKVDAVGNLQRKPLVTSIKKQASTSKASAQSQAQVGGRGKFSTLPRARNQPMKALPLSVPSAGGDTYAKATDIPTTSHQNPTSLQGKSCVSAPVQRKFAPPIASSSPRVPSSAVYSLGTPPRSRNVRSSGYGQQSLNTSRTQEAGLTRIPNPSPGQDRNPRYLPTPRVGNKPEMESGDKKLPASTTGMNSSKIGRAFTRETKENFRQLRKPTSGK